MVHKEIDSQSVSDLIERITPLYNRYRDLVNGSASGKEVLLLMWDVGNILDLFIKKNEIKPHALYWQVYGKAEGLKKSYITRDFLSYCFRIHRYFSNVGEISEKFPSLRRYSLFREAFPLLENPKFKLSKAEEDKITAILNSNVSSQKIKSFIQELKTERIGIKNTRKQKLDSMKPIADNFAAIFSEVYSLIKNNNQVEIDPFVRTFTKELLLALSQAASALTQENLFIPELEDRPELPVDWRSFIKNLDHLLKSNVEARNRFRRVVPPRKLFDLADMLNALTTDHGVTNYKKRKNI